MNRKHKIVEQECSCCGERFWLQYWADGTYTYVGDPCDCEAEFYPIAGSPTILEWLKMIKE